VPRSHVQVDGRKGQKKKKKKKNTTGEKGGIGIELPNGSLLFECAHVEWHATTALACPTRFQPSRVGIVLFCHDKLKLENHGNKQI
jgi:hypothetical protein